MARGVDVSGDSTNDASPCRASHTKSRTLRRGIQSDTDGAARFAQCCFVNQGFVIAANQEPASGFGQGPDAPLGAGDPAPSAAAELLVRCNMNHPERIRAFGARQRAALAPPSVFGIDYRTGR